MKNSNILIRIGMLAVILFTIYLFQGINKPNDFRLLEKPQTVKAVGYTTPAGLYGKEHLVLSNLVLSVNNNSGIEYQINDTPADGYFPDDSDGLVDRVSRRNIYSRGTFSKPKYDRTPWKKVPFEAELYKILTEKYLKVAKNKIDVGGIVD